MSDVSRPPGWYEHPGGAGSLRWWDGVRWSDQAPAVHQPPLPAGTTTNTWAAWVMAVLPVFGIASTVLQDPAGQIRASLQRSLRQLQDPTVVPDPTAAFAQMVTPGALLSYGLSLVLIAANVLLAVRDQRMLADRGLVRPFPWGWAFLQPVYVIGRAVVVRRRVRGSLAPLIVWIVLTAVAIVVGLTVVGVALGSALSSLR